MENRFRYLALFMALAVVTTACAGSKSAPTPEEPAEAATEAVSEAAIEAVSEAVAETSAEEEKEEPLKAPLWEEPENVVNPQFTDDFDEVKDYSAYLEGSTVKSGSRIWIMGKVDEYDKEAKAIKVMTKDGYWIVSVGASGTDDYYKLVEKTVDQYVRIFGVYTGYEADYGMPSMAFQPKDYQKYAFRLESVDNNFRLTQIDYTVSMPEFDTEETFMNIAYKIPSVWTKDDSESGHYYRYPEDTLSSFVMYNYIENAKSGFDEIDADKVLSELADSYADEGDEVLRKQSFKLGGYPALCYEMAFIPDGFPIPLTMFCYMFIVEDQYYFYGVTEPYLIGETSKQLMSKMFADIKYVEGTAAPTSETKPQDSTTEASGKDSAAPADTAKTEAAQTETAKPAHPTKAELEGKVFTMHMKATFTGEKNGETVSFEDEGELPVFLMTSDMIANYSEETGTCSTTYDMEGTPMALTFTFSYNSSGNIVYSAPFTYTSTEFTAIGTVTGHLQ